MPTRKAVKTKISSSLFKSRRIFKPIFHSARLFFASCHEANGTLYPFFISSCMTSASFIACNVSSLQISKRTSNGNPPACMDFRRKTLIAVVKLRPRALYKDSLCFFISESIFILKVDVIDIDITSPVLVYILTIRLLRCNFKYILISLSQQAERIHRLPAFKNRKVQVRART